MENTKTSLQNALLLITAKKIKNNHFVGVRDYVNKQGEKSNYLINSGVSYLKILNDDLKSLNDNKKDIFETLEKPQKDGKIYSLELITTAFNNVLTSLHKRLSDEETKELLRAEGDKTIAQSDAQIDAYINLATGVKLHKDSLKIHVYGLVVRKTILEPIEYKETKSRDLTIVQNKVKKYAGFKQDSYRTFIFDEAEVKMQGLTI
jgi:hypothetical protein